MSNAEIVAYNYGQRLARSAIETVEGGRDDIMPAAGLLTPEEQASLERLGQDAWWKLVVRGGQEILAESDAVRPLQT